VDGRRQAMLCSSSVFPLPYSVFRPCFREIAYFVTAIVTSNVAAGATFFSHGRR